MARPYLRFECVELVIKNINNAIQVNFPDLPQLRSDMEKDCIIRSIETYSSQEIPLSFNQNPLANETQLGQTFVTLYVDGEESIFRIPLPRLRTTNRSAAAAAGSDSFWADEKSQFMNLKVDWTKSYITPSGSLANGAQICFLFGIEYIYGAPGSYAKYKTARDTAFAAGIFPQ